MLVIVGLLFVDEGCVRLGDQVRREEAVDELGLDLRGWGLCTSQLCQFGLELGAGSKPLLEQADTEIEELPCDLLVIFQES